jgi:hypothetical protein
MTLEQPSEAPRRYIIYGVYPKHQFKRAIKTRIICNASEDAAIDKKKLHMMSQAQWSVDYWIFRHMVDKGDHDSEVKGLAIALARIFGIHCIRYEAWMLVISMEFVHSGVWFGLP